MGLPATGLMALLVINYDFPYWLALPIALVVGTSAVVYPAAYLPHYTREHSGEFDGSFPPRFLPQSHPLNHPDLRM
jgi:hypothetical protein